NQLGQALSATAIIEAHVNEWIDYHPLDGWIAKLEKLLNERSCFSRSGYRTGGPGHSVQRHGATAEPPRGLARHGGTARRDVAPKTQSELQIARGPGVVCL